MDAHTEMTAPPEPGASGSPPTDLWHRTFPGEPGQVRAVRDWIEGLLPESESRDILILIASEFATNSIEHTRSGCPGGQFTVRLDWSSSTARLTVEDEGSPTPPEAVAAALDAEHGRGLFMVNALASDWGFADTPGGRLLWADTPWHSEGSPAQVKSVGDLPTI